jgi:hypothetical protein
MRLIPVRSNKMLLANFLTALSAVSTTAGAADVADSGSATTAPVWARDHFQIVAIGVGKVDPASAIVMIDLARAATPRVGPILETLFADAAEDGIEIDLGNQESVVLWLDRSIGGREIERHPVVEFYHFEGAEPDWRRPP